MKQIKSLFSVKRQRRWLPLLCLTVLFSSVACSTGNKTQSQVQEADVQSLVMTEWSNWGSIEELNISEYTLDCAGQLHLRCYEQSSTDGKGINFDRQTAKIVSEQTYPCQKKDFEDLLKQFIEHDFIGLNQDFEIKALDGWQFYLTLHSKDQIYVRGGIVADMEGPEAFKAIAKAFKAFVSAKGLRFGCTD